MSHPVSKKQKTKGSDASVPLESIYRKLTPREHILARPDTYIGSTELDETLMWVWKGDVQTMLQPPPSSSKKQKNTGEEKEEESQPQPAVPELKLNYQKIRYSPGLYKIFDEILVNAADNKQRDPSMNVIEVQIHPETHQIRVRNNGKSIDIAIHKEHKVYIPELIFGHTLSSSCFNDEVKKTTGGRNGYGAKLTNIYSKSFSVEIVHQGTKYIQHWRDNMSICDPPILKKVSDKVADYTQITFIPDLSRFGMQHLDEDILRLMIKRVCDLAGTCAKPLRVHLNGHRISFKSFSEYADMYLSSETDVKKIYEKVNDRWEMCLIPSTQETFQQVSFCNNVCTSKGGTHVQLVLDQLVKALQDKMEKKLKQSVALTPTLIKNQLFVFVNALIENPTFDSQTKENLTLKKTAFGSTAVLSEKFLRSLVKGDITQRLISVCETKKNKELSKQDGKKKIKLTGIPKLDDANHAGGKSSSSCTLILTEGDSAKALAVAGLSVLGRDKYGVFPLKGKFINVREASHQKIMSNEEVNALKQILGLQTGKDYQDVSSLRYGHIMIMADQDHDGSHIKGLLFNFFALFWPSLLKIPGFMSEFITPIVKVTLHTTPRQSMFFYSLPEYETWKTSAEAQHQDFSMKYYKGLGTSTSQEAKEYFSKLEKHRIVISYQTDQDKESLELAFSKKKADARKVWLSNHIPGSFVDSSSATLKMHDFVHKELIEFAMAANVRSIPSVVDGLKVSQRKILHCSFQKKLDKEIRVAQLAGYVSEHSAYHHGEKSLTDAIVGLARTFVGSNNIHLLVPAGQFGTRLQGGADAASARYIHTQLYPVTHALFPKEDLPLLHYLNEDEQVIEPSFFVPVLPMALINGAEGMGMAWSTFIPNYNPMELCTLILERLQKGSFSEKVHKLVPWYRDFKGFILPKAESSSSFWTVGLIESTSETSYAIRELPIQKWTQDYKVFLEQLVVEARIKDFQDACSESDVHFEIFVTEEQKKKIEAEGVHSFFRLTSSLSTSNMMLYQPNGQLKKYNHICEIIQDWFEVRWKLYQTRKDYLLAKLDVQKRRLENKVQFILALLSGQLVLNNKKKADVLKDLKKLNVEALQLKEKEETDEKDKDQKSSFSYEYLLTMPLSSLTYEQVQTLQKQVKELKQKVEETRQASISSLWTKDLLTFKEAWNQTESQRKEERHKQKKKPNTMTVTQGVVIVYQPKFENKLSNPKKRKRDEQEEKETCLDESLLVPSALFD